MWIIKDARYPHIGCQLTRFHGPAGEAAPPRPTAYGGLNRGSRFRPPSLTGSTRSCAELEGDSLSLLEKLYQKPVVPVGLLPAKVNDSERAENWDSLRQWHDEKIQNSVLYVAIGTEFTLSQDEMNELASGIEKSGLPFIWVVKTKDDPIITGFESRVSGRGLVWANWAPQKQILAHPSIGGFLTHCGWSSVIEALGLGRVLILFPGASSDLGLVARLLEDKRVGLEVLRDNRDGSFTSDSVSELVRQFMVEEKDEQLTSKEENVAIYRISGVDDTTFREEKSEEVYFAKNGQKIGDISVPNDKSPI
ncbi:UDP-glycosyltransferase 91C1 [Vitis vinifera]|uniref:UDP-glycosyltransferase 91C1 n=1 Tax=Vitis vinifera TaxID=29760 RepID=A0A438J953_VITVI|nr:UDP-glycosyltransferase 91C1 [Vitis vinifera]